MRILLLGSTGSIGKSTCACINRHPGRFTLTGISANNNTELLKEQIHRYAPESVCLCNKEIHESFPDYNGSVFRGADG
ncbi:MAG: 1-deoxy-D-xylulose-5-phosphate reductoisomerase, partial [Chitinivibrionales bacterium]